MAAEKLILQNNRISISFRQKVAAIFTLLIAFVMLLSVYLVTHQVKKTSLKRAEESGRLLGRIIALSMGEDIVRDNLQAINYALKEIVQLEKIEYCLILDNFGRIISSTDNKLSGQYFSDAWSRSALTSPSLSIRRAVRNNKPVYDTSVPIRIGGKRHAIIRIGFTLDEELASIRNLLVYNLSLGIALILCGIFIAYAVSSTLLSPLNAILNSLEKMRKGDFTQQAHIRSHDEFEQLALSFNKLSSFLQSRKESENFTSKRLWEADNSLKRRHFSGKAIEAVVIHLELHRFSSYIERHSPSEAVDTLNSFFSHATFVIAESGGVIDKYGDGFITAIFPQNDDEPWPNFLRAAFAALATRSQLGQINFRQTQLGLEDLNLKIGIAAGEVIIGNIGTASRTDFTALGQPINQAKKASEYSRSGNNFKPVGTSELVKISSDFLNFSRHHDEKGNRENDDEYFVLESFANLSYFSERLKDSSENGQKKIILALGLTETKEGLSALEEIIKTTANHGLKLEAIKAMTADLLCEIPGTAEFLAGLIKEGHDAQAIAVATSVLSTGRKKENSDLFVDLFNHEDDRVRANAVEACIPIEFPGKRELFKKMLRDPASRVCGNALLGLWQLDDQETLACLYSMLKADDSAKRASGAFAVYFLAASRRFRRLFPAYSEDRGFVVLPIIENIVKRLKSMLESPETSERLQALRAAGKIGYSDLGDSIKELTEYETEPEILSLAHSILKEWEFHSSEGS